MLPVANCLASACCDCASTLMVKPAPWVKAARLLDSRRMLHSTRRGLSETELKELQVIPQSCPCQCVVTTVTPVAKHDRALR